jgi:cytochrome c556
MGAQDAELHRWMESADRTVVALEKVETKTGAQAVTAAERLGGIYEDMIGFWRQRNASDAVKWSVAGKAASVQMAAAAYAGDSAQAAESFKTIAGTCTACHEKYREQLPSGKYRIK